MRYLLLLTNTAEEVAAWDAMDAEEARGAREASIPRWNALFERMQEKGQWLDGLELDTPGSAKTVREGDVVTDGPYAETKEQIGGFFLVDCESLDEAIELASLVPVAETASVEVRPLE